MSLWRSSFCQSPVNVQVFPKPALDWRALLVPWAQLSPGVYWTHLLSIH